MAHMGTDMNIISSAELRRNLATYLRAVAEGQTIRVTISGVEAGVRVADPLLGAVRAFLSDHADVDVDVTWTARG